MAGGTLRKGQHPRLKRRKGADGTRSADRKFTRKNKQIVYEAIANGMPRICCADLIGVTSVTWSQWMTRATEFPDSAYAAFKDKCAALKAAREKEALEVIKNCGKGKYTKTDTTIKKNAAGEIEVTKRTTQMYPQWQAAAWYLERRRAKHYSLNQPALDKTPEDHAREIKDAYDSIMNSVPDKPEPWCNRIPEED